MNGSEELQELGVKTYDRLQEAEEELSDISAYDRTRAKAHAEVKAGQALSLTSIG